jgi:sugar (pentulose or hexulose) kinase
LSIRAPGATNFLSAWNSTGTTMAPSPDPAAFRRGNLIPHEVLFDAQHFSFGASYNYGLNNMWHSGGFGGASKNPGLSLHAGFSF